MRTAFEEKMNFRLEQEHKREFDCKLTVDN